LQEETSEGTNVDKLYSIKQSFQIFIIMKKAKFNAKEFLKVKTLSPLEQNQLRGGFGEAEAADGVVVKQVRQQVVQQVQRVIGL
jgi:hypothetical protein